MPTIQPQPVEIARIKARIAEGAGIRQLIAEFGHSFEWFNARGLKALPRVAVCETPAIIDRVRELFADGKTGLEVLKILNIGATTLRRIQRNNNLRPMTRAERLARWPKEPTPKPQKAPKYHYTRLKGYQPQVATTDIEVAVDKLRRRVIVFAESTLKYPSQTPHRYCEQTVFRVGSHRNVPASKVLEMARQV